MVDPDSEPTFAISMPIGGWHPLLPAALRSLAIQDARFELAVLDASGDARVRDALDASGIAFVFRREGPDAGQAAAIAEGWRHARGDVLAWLNADDLLMPGALRRAVVEFSSNPGVDVVFGDSTIIEADGSILGVHGQVGDVDSGISIINCISQPSCFFKRSAVDRVGGLNEHLGYSMDWELWIRMQRAGCRFVRLPDFFSAVYWGQETKTSELSFPRLSELFSHSRRYAGLVAAWRMLLGVLTQAVMSNAQVRNVFGDVAQRRSNAGLFICADGNPREQPADAATLPLINVSAEPRSLCRVETSGGACNLETSEPSQIRQVSDGVWQIKFLTPVLPAAATELRISCVGRAARLNRVSWLEEATDSQEIGAASSMA